MKTSKRLAKPKQISPEHDLSSFMRAEHASIEREYDRIRSRAHEDPGTAGDQGEENWATILRNWLPPYYQIETKGRVLFLSGKTSGQVDIIVLHPTYPKGLWDKKHYLAGGVAAVFECKLTLKKEHIDTTFQRAAQLRRMLLKREGTPYRELHTPILYGLLAHSWNGKKQNARGVIDESINLSDKNHVLHPREMLDLVCVADVGTWTAHKSPWSPPENDPSLLARVAPEQDPWLYKPHAMTSYTQWGWSERQPELHPIGTMLSCLLLKLGREDAKLQPLARYFSDALRPSGKGIGRMWDLDIYSPKLRKQLGTIDISPDAEWGEWTNRFE